MLESTGRRVFEVYQMLRDGWAKVGLVWARLDDLTARMDAEDAEPRE